MSGALSRRSPRVRPALTSGLFWSDLRNHMRLEPGVERIELDGPFATGTTGRTAGPEVEHHMTVVDATRLKTPHAGRIPFRDTR
jgi:hypothetical protein